MLEKGSKSFQLTYSEEFLKYNLGPSHPMNPRRIAAAMGLFNFLAETSDNFQLVGPNPVDPSTLELAHSKEYIATLTRMSEPGFDPSYEERMNALAEFGFGTGDCPIVEHVAEVSEIIAGSTVSAAEGMMNNQLSKSFVLLAGLHHASRSRASGFCYYNDINIAIRRLQEKYSDIKILYLDTDLHAGDGVNYEFFNDPSVLTFSLHESGRFLFPGTCFANEVGSGDGVGFSANLPLFPYTYGDLYLKAFKKYVPVLMESFQPDIVIWQAGVDGHAQDPLGHLYNTTPTYHEFGKLLSKYTESMDTQRLLALGGGGYNPSSVARSWYAEVSGLAGIEPIVELPLSWVDEMNKLYQIDLPTKLYDEEEELPFETKEEEDKLEMLMTKAQEDFEKYLSPYWAVN